MGESAYDRINDYGAVKIGLASPYDIRSWSFGEVKKPETINYRTYRPEKDGLFCERIFGPEKDWECACGKYRGMKYKGMICDRCGVKVTHSRVRRKRMGHIELAAPVVHIWFFKAMPSRLGTLLDMRTTSLERIIYFQDYVVVDPGDTPLKERQLMTEEEFRKAKEQYKAGGQYNEEFQADMGAEAVRKLLMRLDLVSLSKQLRQELVETSSKQKIKDLTKRLKVVEALRDSDNRPEWMVLECIPVIPPDLRPLVLLDSGNFATSDLNDLYRRIINRNNRLKKLVDLNAPEVIIRNEKRMLQQAVDALFDNNRCKRPVLGSSNRPLEVADRHDQGQAGPVPREPAGQARRLLGPVGDRRRAGLEAAPVRPAQEDRARAVSAVHHPAARKSWGTPTRSSRPRRCSSGAAKRSGTSSRRSSATTPSCLNRAPTLHRMGIQAFEPVLVEGNAIRIHPLVCKGFNADFDGDQMAVHLPLSIEAQVEAMTLMMATNNIFSPANGNPIISPTQDIVMGAYYLTVSRPSELGEGMTFSTPNEVFLAHSQKKVGVHAMINLRLPASRRLRGDGEKEFKPGMIIKTTVGRVVFNDILHARMPFYNLTLGQKQLQSIIADCYQILGRRETIALLDRMKDLGFRESTRSGLSFATDDLKTPPSKDAIIAEAEKEVTKQNQFYQRGIITDQERYNKVLDAWTHARERITAEMMEALRNDSREGEVYLNPIFLMAESGARGGVEQIRQLAGMRGLMAKPSGKIIETPIKANFREGLSVLEYFSSTHGARKGLADTALEDGRQRLPDPQAGRRRPERRDHHGRLRHLAGHHQGGHLQGREGRGQPGAVDPRPRQPGQHRRPAHRRGRGQGERDDHPGRGQEARGDADREDPGPQPDDLRSLAGRLPRLLRHGPGHRPVGRGGHGRRDHRRAVDRRAGHPAHDADLPHRRRRHPRRRGKGRQEQARGQGQVRRPQHRRSTTRGRRSPCRATARSRSSMPRGASSRSTTCPTVPIMMVEDGQTIARGSMLCEWDPHNIPILAEVGGKVRFDDIVEGETMKIEIDPSGHVRRTIIEHKGDLHPQVIIVDAEGKTLDYKYIPERASIEVNDGQMISAGTLLAKTPREVGGTQDITGGLPRVTELFEARRPKEPAVIAEIDGRVELLEEKRRGKRTIIVRNESGIEREHLVPHGKYLRVHGGDRVRAGDPLVEGPLVPHDILRISGEEAVQRYLLREIQNVYRSQRVEIDDKHLEIIIAQMLRKVRVDSVGDTPLLPGSVIDKFEFRRVNHGADELREDQGPRRHRVPRRRHRPPRPLRAGKPPRRGGRRAQGRVDPAQAGGGQHPAPGDHQGGRAVRELHLGRQLPGDDQGPDRGRPGRQGRLPGRSQGKRHPGPPGAGRHRLQGPSRRRGPHPARSARGPGRQRPRLRPLPRRGDRRRPARTEPRTIGHPTTLKSGPACPRPRDAAGRFALMGWVRSPWIIVECRR